MKKYLFILLIISLFGVNSYGQVGKYLVLFKDKNSNTYSTANPIAFVSQRSIDRRAAQGIAFTQNDLPPTKAYIDGLISAGATVWYKSRWLNAALVLMTPVVAANVLALPYVKGFENNGPMDLNAVGAPLGRKADKFQLELEDINYGSSATQVNMLGLQHLHNAGLKGEGKIIAVLDDGFNSVNLDTYLASLFSENRVAETFDFSRFQTQVYDIGGHGNYVLSTMAANVQGSFVGTAPQAKYALYRTENASGERIIEEANYLFGCERADSLGADIINSSLGYVNFDYAPYNHSASDLNGDKTLVTRAADWAARVGILVCTSAGNSGASGINAPADADSVLAIGAVTAAEIKSGFSSVGPTADNRTKPDIAAMGSSATVSAYYSGSTHLQTSSGTSFSSPISAGFAACFWQANPEMNNMQIIAAIKAIATQSASPDNNLGWGIPKIPNISIAQDQDEKVKNIQPGIQNSFLTAGNTRIIAQLLPTNPSPVTGSVTAKVMVDLAVNTINGSPTVTRHFTIIPAMNSAIATAKLTLFVTQAELDYYNSNNGSYTDLMLTSTDNSSKANLRILDEHIDGLVTSYTSIDPIDSDIKWNAMEGFWEISFNVTGFSNFYITSQPAVALPVQLLSFSGKNTTAGNLLSWEITPQSNLSQFELQSVDLQGNIGYLGTIYPNKSSDNYRFQYLDLPIFDHNQYYYRLKMLDTEGKISYSNIIIVLGENKLKFEVKTNPFHEKIEVNLLSKVGEGIFKIYDARGYMKFEAVPNHSDFIIATTTWPAGVYILQYQQNGQIQRIKLVKE